MKRLIATTILAALATGAAAQTTQLRPDQQAFFGLYKELVETNTTLSSGSCTQAAAQIAVRLKAAGFPEDAITSFAVPEHPKDGGIVAILPGSSKTAKPILLLAHVDVVEAKRADWTRDPFKLIEEDGYYYARGAVDDKMQAAIWADTLIRFKQSGYKPKHTIKLALTCGEETTYAFNGAEWLAKNKPDLIAAEFALNEGGGGRLDDQGNVVSQSVQVGEKAVQNYRIETTNPGGHSSIPVRENAIYELADALAKLRDYEFPVHLNPVTQTFFATMGKTVGGEVGQAMSAIAANPNDAAANAVLSKDRAFHSMLRTTCVATLVDGGHANNALPQRAGANVNCRIAPGETVETTAAALTSAIGDPKLTLVTVPPLRPIAIVPPLSAKVLKPMQTVGAKYFPGLAIVPTMSTGATDGIFLEAIGIPVYGVPGHAGSASGDGVHGLNEKVQIKSLYRQRDYLYDLVKVYAEAV